MKVLLGVFFCIQGMSNFVSKSRIFILDSTDFFLLITYRRPLKALARLAICAVLSEPQAYEYR